MSLVGTSQSTLGRKVGPKDPRRGTDNEGALRHACYGRAMVPVEILGLHFEPRSGLSVVLLSEVDIPTKVLPILVGTFRSSRDHDIAVRRDSPETGDL